MKHISILLICSVFSHLLQAQVLPGFKLSGSFDEQQMVIENSVAETRVLINAPLSGFHKNKSVLLVFYALPNGNTIEQTFGKKLNKDDDQRFDIQQIGAQTRYLRTIVKNRTIVVAYAENASKSWPAWKAITPDYQQLVKKTVDEVKALFSGWNTEIVLNGHSGGGRFIFSYIDAFEDIPDDVVRIAFLDSNYGYEDYPYGLKLVKWLKSGKNKFLCTLAYNDSIVVYNSKPLVSPTGGTWYRSKLMHKYFSGSFRFKQQKHDSLIWNNALNGRVQIILKPNPSKIIYHTVQVERNGFIHSMLSGTKLEQKGYSYFGNRAYNRFIADTVIIPICRLKIPPRNDSAETGSAFICRIASMLLQNREEEIFKAVAAGNIPAFLRNTVTMNGVFTDAGGMKHQVIYETMPDYLSVGCDSDFCRIPMSPYTAQQIALLFGASLPTSKISDHIYTKARVKLIPISYLPVQNANELPSKFALHNAQIETQRKAAGGINGDLIAGIKKDVILSKRIADNPNKVVIYGWHKSDGSPIQPVYSGHTGWYLDYSHGIRLINNQVLLDGKPALLSEILKHPLLFKTFSDEDSPMEQTIYFKP